MDYMEYFGSKKIIIKPKEFDNKGDKDVALPG
jgi:hypothetical protein